MSAPGSVVLAISTPVEELPELFLPALQQTVQMVGITVILAILLGTPLAVILHNTAPSGLFPNPAVNAVAGWVVNLGRSLPFLVLMAAIIPFTRFVVGTSLGVQAAAVPMTLAATPYVARLIENSLRDVPPDVVEVGRASAGSNFQIIRKVQLHEAVPTIIGALTIALIGILDMSAIAGAVGAGGIGNLAIAYGYNRFDNTVMITTVIALVVLVQVIQLVGDLAARLTNRR